MKIFEQRGLFDEFSDETIIDDYSQHGYILTQDLIPMNNLYSYKIYDKNNHLVDIIVDKESYVELSENKYNNSILKKYFKALCENDRIKKSKEKREKSLTNNNYQHNIFDYRNYRSDNSSKGFLEKLNKSDTLVIHCADRTTDMLKQIYQGKNWDILNDGNIDKNELHELLKSHDRIVMLGHGTGSGLINKQGYGFIIGADEAKYLKNKKIFAIWCNADIYFSKYNIGKGCFITKNVPSDANEASWVGYKVSESYMLENITYWSKLCADVVDIAFNNAQKAVDYVREKYQEKYGHDEDPNKVGVTNYNTDAVQVQK